MNNKTLPTCVENIELWSIMGKQKIIGWKSTLQLDKVDSMPPIRTAGIVECACKYAEGILHNLQNVCEPLLTMPSHNVFVLTDYG